MSQYLPVFLFLHLLKTQSFTSFSNNAPFTAALWVKAVTVIGGTIIHLSTLSTGLGTACFDLLGLTTGGYLVAQLYTTYPCCGIYSTTAVIGPLLQTNTWIHLAVSYSSANGLRIFVNGSLNTFTAQTSALSSFPFGITTVPLYITVGNSSPSGASVASCISTLVSSGPFQGTIDDIHIYSRELSITEVCALANP